jgi:hypothetical protein
LEVEKLDNRRRDNRLKRDKGAKGQRLEVEKIDNIRRDNRLKRDKGTKVGG